MGGFWEFTVKMKRIGNILLFASLFIISHGQQLDSKKIKLIRADKQIELFQENPGSEQFLIVKNLDGDTTNTIELPDEFDPYRFTDIYEGERSFIVISGRNKFYLFNIITEKIIGPISATPRRELADAQSGVWYTFKILNNGQYLLANALDFGLYC